MVGWAANCSLAYDKIVVEYISEAVVRNNNLGVSFSTIRLAIGSSIATLALCGHCGSSYKLEPNGEGFLRKFAVSH